MTQVFSRRAGLYAQLLLLGVLLAIGTGVLIWRAMTAEANGVDETVEQPIPFSHKHHVADVGLDCRYCHASVETSPFAGMPPISTCMTCHSQLFTDQAMFKPLVDAWVGKHPLSWRRVYQLPDFVYFDHSIHVAKGVGCESCHGRVDQMPLTRRVEDLSMKWCLSCHREPEQALRPRDKITAMDWHVDDQKALGEALVQAYQIDKRKLTDCSTCHR